MVKRGGFIAAVVGLLAILSIAVGTQVIKSAAPTATASAAPTTGETVAAATATPSPAGVHRSYFIAADTVKWNFAPQGKNMITNEPFGDRENTYLAAADDRIGAVNTMSQYRQYTDSTFATLVPRSDQDAYQGILGPTIFAAVGDTIDIVFKNNTPFPASMHPHGVFYAKDSEGAPYNDGTSGEDKSDDAVPSGGTHTYKWQVPERAGPGPMDPSSIVWMYHSHSDEVKDTNSGLVGAIVISRAGQANPDGTPKGVDRNIVVDFQIFDQNQSLYLDQEIAGLKAAKTVSKDDDEFIESNLKHSINGYVYGNMPMIDMKVGQRVRWYVMAFGTEVDVHTPHWHGNTVVISGMRMDMTQLIAGSMITAEMVPDDPGIWLFHCHVNDHILAGMLTRYEVLSA
jgi:FtsP/CotA-like multicopper oxidase with cupredoxin domain